MSNIFTQLLLMVATCIVIIFGGMAMGIPAPVPGIVAGLAGLFLCYRMAKAS